MEFEQILTMLGTLDRGEVEIEVRASFSKTFWSDHAGVGPKARSKIIADRIGSTIGFRFVCVYPLIPSRPFRLHNTFSLNLDSMRRPRVERIAVLPNFDIIALSQKHGCTRHRK